MKRMLFRSIAFIILAASDIASAADMPMPPTPAEIAAVTTIYDWTGFYMGFNGGGAWGQSSQSKIGLGNPSTGNFSLSGGMAGGTVGFNFQNDFAVLGLEGDFGWADVSGGSTNCPGIGITCTTKSDYLGTVRGRLGYAWNQWMPYVTAGAAIGDVKQSFSPAIGINNGETSNRIGWTAGGGVEFAFAARWSAKLEYLHVDLGTFICGIACSGVAGQTINTTFTEEVIRAGINYRF